MFKPGSHLLVTGGTGFFGLALLRHLQSFGGEPIRVSVLSRDPARFRTIHPELARLVEWKRGDVLAPDSLPRTHQYSHILHAATDSTLGPKLTPLERYIQIVEGTRNILELAVASGAKRFLLTSSGGVYGPQPGNMERIPEDYNGMPNPLDSQNAYSVAKRCAEHLCALYQSRHGLETVIARCFAFVGRDLPVDAHFAIGNFVRDALINSDIFVEGDGSPVRSYMDQRDLAHWLVTLVSRGEAGQAYNVGSDVPITIADLAYKVRELLAPGKPVRIACEETAQSFRNRYVPSIDKSKKQLGLTLSHSLDAAIQWTADCLSGRIP
jgi:UDP-glucuronate decarboxylase